MGKTAVCTALILANPSTDKACKVTDARFAKLLGAYDKKVISVTQP